MLEVGATGEIGGATNALEQRTGQPVGDPAFGERFVGVPGRRGEAVYLRGETPGSSGSIRGNLSSSSGERKTATTGNGQRVGSIPSFPASGWVGRVVTHRRGQDTSRQH